MSALITICEAAKVLGISRITVYRRIKDGTIPTVQLGPKAYISSAWLSKFTEQSATTTAPVAGVK